MATVSVDLVDDRKTVVLVAHHTDFDVIEHMDSQTARKLAVTLLSAAGRAERTSVTSEWP